MFFSRKQNGAVVSAPEGSCTPAEAIAAHQVMSIAGSIRAQFSNSATGHKGEDFNYLLAKYGLNTNMVEQAILISQRNGYAEALQSAKSASSIGYSND